MDADALFAIPGVFSRPLSRLLPALVRQPQGVAWRLLGDSIAADSKHLAQFLHARAQGHHRWVPDVPTLNICIVSSASPRSRSGNRITALRWARILRELGHRVRIEPQYRGGNCDLMIALHARRSGPSIRLFRRAFPKHPLILALTGTDLYRDIHVNSRARSSLKLATALVTLQPLGLRQLPAAFRSKAVSIYQSARSPPRRPSRQKGYFKVCVIGHLRPVKDPFRAALAARLLPESSRIGIDHYGKALSREMATRARREAARNSRYRWIGQVPHGRILAALNGCQLVVLTSRMEGGANVIAEALACGVPVISTRIEGSVGLLGARHPGYFRVGDTRGLAKLLWRVETDSRFRARLSSGCRRRAYLIRPERERRAWKALLRRLR